MMDKKALVGFSLKFSGEDKRRLKQLCLNEGLQFQYQLFDAAVSWSVLNRATLLALANPKNGSYSSYYLSLPINELMILQDSWNCNSSRALYSAVLNYLRFKSVTIEYSEVTTVEPDVLIANY